MGTLCFDCPKYFIDHPIWGRTTSCLVCPKYFISTNAHSGWGQCVLSVRNILFPTYLGWGASCLSEIFYCRHILLTYCEHVSGLGTSCLLEIFYCQHIWGGASRELAAKRPTPVRATRAGSTQPRWRMRVSFQTTGDVSVIETRHPLRGCFICDFAILM